MYALFKDGKQKSGVCVTKLSIIIFYSEAFDNRYRHSAKLKKGYTIEEVKE